MPKSREYPPERFTFVLVMQCLQILVMPKSKEYPLERITIVLVMPKSKKITTRKKYVCSSHAEA